MRILLFFIGATFFFSLAGSILAIYDPLSVSNNKMGIHILFPSELHTAAQMINGVDKGSWGYVTVPIQSTDRNRKKWQDFFNQCVVERVIPIIRVATTPKASNWEEPNNLDLLDFANFLNDLNWPVQNRYVIVFNEVNRPDEYGGKASPEKYADILNSAIDIFKSRSSDFFILPAGLDNAAVTGNGAIHRSTYLRRMHDRQPNIFNKIDGWTSHAYPNPDFSVRPDLSGNNKIDSFRYDLTLLRRFTTKKLPVFITETGWSNRFLSDSQISHYYQYAFSKVWSDPNIVTVTPFLLNAQDGPFKQFSFLNNNQKPKEFAFNLSVLAQIGQPIFPASSVPSQLIEQPVVIQEYAPASYQPDPYSELKTFYNNLKSLFSVIE
ncbi:hypothetical protein AUJ42_01190 [Candidatus Collierbacteria bacterium CG1_02_44_10]|uniref:Asl1-like glycosyl hydrolase catalytic domain-containing protein n=1 Tax=Candidatus Collierbacteria bacterium CG1_02_44_10 TaxID=1805087 RepID=A0A1J4RXC3_9BACT|nr:MAG: hypothetical protein AUJ42_01190 [Candidatus Collierbacteria bacterium CG1_02_44_10]